VPRHCFVDTNILVYAHDRGGGVRHEAAKVLVEQLWHDRTGVISTQVLQEFYVNVRRRAASPLALDEVRPLLEDYLRWKVVVNDGQSVLRAMSLEERYRISFWDALI
jgi:predicted nucleic acid-binding protein